jgi:hypothetical protein
MTNEELIQNVITNLRMMFEHGVDGASIASDDYYRIDVMLIDKNKPKHYRGAAWLKTEYVDRRRSMQDIASEFGITAAAINQWLNRHNIPTRSRGSKT